MLPRRPLCEVGLGRCALLDGDMSLAETARLAHSHTIGTTRSGKTNYLKHLAMQDIDRGRGVMVIDPHGGDPATPRAEESLYASLLTHCQSSRLIETGTVHILDPSRTSHA